MRPKPHKSEAARSVVRILAGRLVTGNVARLTVYHDGGCTLERQAYVSPHADNWQQVYEAVEGKAIDYYWLEEQLRKNAATWPE